ncbi:TonB-dependent receptor [Shewanella xiamenensis]|uniref:TonB-dependent receptor n=1 Tax=Shewanella xiamenensis TaxID=332186 RepID=UPI000849C674|nr:TonB-dependent receptor [Shewanella xiamenensis]ODR85535.1 TonB-dependent receptor [Shewanella xiamenensis]
MTFKTSFVALAVFAALTQSAIAQEKSDTEINKNKEIERITVTASRMDKSPSSIPNTVTIIDRVQLEEQFRTTKDLSTIIGNLAPSFSPSRQKMSNTGETLRGRAPLIMIDGVPQSNPLRSGGRSGQTIDPAMIERIEIIHGANAMHGLGAQGGIINYITKKPTGDNQHVASFDVTVPDSLKSNGVSFGASYAFSGESELIDMLGSVSYRNNGVYYDANHDVIGVDTTQGESMDSQSKDFFIKLGHNFTESRLELMVNHYNMDNNGDWMAVPGDKANGIPTSGVEEKQPWEAANNLVTTTSLTYTHENIAGQQLSMQLFNQDFQAVYGGGCFDSFYDPSFEGSDQVVQCGVNSKGEHLYYEQSRNSSVKWGLKTSLIAKNIADMGIDAAYGIDLFRDTTEQDLVKTGFSWVPESTYDNFAPYLQLDYDLIKDLTLSAGVRYEHAKLSVDDYKTLYGAGNKQIAGGDATFDETLFNVGVSYKITPDIRIYTSYNQGFGMPDIGRILRDGKSFPGANPSISDSLALTPIVTDNVELGADYQGEFLSAKISYYRSATDYGARLALNSDGFYDVKREKSVIDGIEANITAYLTSNDDLGMNLAIQRGEYDVNGDNKVDTDLDGANISPNRINLFWAHNFDNEMSTRVQANYFMDRDFENATGAKYAEFDGYTTVDASFSMPLYTGSLTLGVQNLFNKDYFNYYSQTMGTNDRYFKGMGRTATIGYTVAF